MLKIMKEETPDYLINLPSLQNVNDPAEQGTTTYYQPTAAIK